jgi:GH15 family glucan-1,4-alpha-glucosidase
MREDGYLPIGDYGAIGDGHTVALAGRDGAIDWMCLPEIDGEPVFAALLDPERGGRWTLAPEVPFEAEQRYVERTSVLQTTFKTAEGSVRVTDAVTLDPGERTPWRELVRQVEGLAGEVPLAWRFEPRARFDGGSFEFRPHGEGLVARCGSLALGLQTWDAGVQDGRASGRFTAREGDCALLALTAVDGVPLPLPKRDAVLRRLDETAGVWRSWVTRHTYEGPWRDAVERSLMAIRLLADGRTGAITAAGTTSLPEVLGGERNYDYRFGWVRDVSFTLDALLAVGFEELTHGSMTWLLGAVDRTHPRVDPVYSLDGEVIRSQEQRSLPGYRRTHPVVVGNAAGSQLQLGGFGDLLETVQAYAEHGHVLLPEIGERLADCVDLLCELWQCEDAGLWELPDRAHYATSKLGCWVAVDRLLKLVDAGQAPARHVERWRRERDAIAGFIEDRLYSPQRRSYLQRAGSEDLDCGTLLAARRGFGDPGGERMLGTIEAIRAELGAGGPLLYRYSGMQGEENAFLACSFWLVEALALAGGRDEAAALMDELVGLGGDTGLLSEEIEPGSRRLRGNLPQALTHLSLINAAAALGS